MAKTYYPIPSIGIGRGALQGGLRARIYAGADHLLIVQSTGYTEEYKRVFYRDIRYLITQKNQAQAWQGVISGLLGLIFFLISYASGVSWMVWSFFVIPFLLWFLVNLVRGPSCSCYINTHVQTVKLPAPGRLSKVPALLSFLREKAPGAQAVHTEQATP